MSWGVDFTTRARSDLVGLPSDLNEAIVDALVTWARNGPPLENSRTMLEITFHEATIADRLLLAYAVDDSRQRFVVLWIREKPGAKRL